MLEAQAAWLAARCMLAAGGPRATLDGLLARAARAEDALKALGGRLAAEGLAAQLAGAAMGPGPAGGVVLVVRVRVDPLGGSAAPAWGPPADGPCWAMCA